MIEFENIGYYGEVQVCIIDFYFGQFFFIEYFSENVNFGSESYGQGVYEDIICFSRF